MTRIVQVTTHPFGTVHPHSRETLEVDGLEIRYNPYHRRLKPSEVAGLVEDAHGIVAGTEPYTKEVIDRAKSLQVIARVGVGLDNVDIRACRARGITVTFTPEAPADAVAELTVAQILNLMRHVHRSDRSVRERAWNRFMGHLVREWKIGILGVGRIGKRVVRLLQPFQPNLFACDLRPDEDFGREYNLTWMDRMELFATCDLVTAHVPMTAANHHLISTAELRAMKPGGYVVNTARGKIVDEAALLEALEDDHLGGAAIDVYESEPYDGRLIHHDNVVLTAHIAGSAKQSRYLMELGAAEDCVRVLQGRPPANEALDSDFGLE